MGAPPPSGAVTFLTSATREGGLAVHPTGSAALAKCAKEHRKEGVGEGVMAGEGVWLGLGVPVCEGLGVPVCDELGVPVRDPLGVPVRDPLGVPVRLPLGVPERDPLGVPVWLLVPVIVPVIVPVRLGVIVPVYVTVGLTSTPHSWMLSMASAVTGAASAWLTTLNLSMCGPDSAKLKLADAHVLSDPSSEHVLEAKMGEETPTLSEGDASARDTPAPASTCRPPGTHPSAVSSRYCRNMLFTTPDTLKTTVRFAGTPGAPARRYAKRDPE